MRRAVQFAMLALFFVLIGISRYPFQEILPVDLFLKLDPLLSITASLATGALVPAFWLGVLVLVLTFVLGRFFCGWMCPLGTCLDACEWAVYRKKKRRRKNSALVARNAKLYLLAFLAAGAALGHSFAYLVDPISLVTRLFTYAVVPMLAFAGNLGLDIVRPAAERMDWYGIARFTFRPQLFSAPAAFTFLFFCGIVALSSLQPRFWCRSLCPLGGLFSLFSRVPVFRRRVGITCDNEGICATVCETGAIPKEKERSTRHGECIVCMKCVHRCHKDVTEFAVFAPEADNLGTDPQRRKILAGAAAGAASAFFLTLSPSRVLRDERAIRPPGALPENAFLETCVRCGQCVKACPTNTLQPALGPGGAGGLFAPVHNMRLAGCDQDCNVCGQTCPTQAIRDLPIEEKSHAKIGTARIEPHRCVVWAYEMQCLVCDEGCPYNAIYWKEEAGVRRPYVDQNRCNGCGICEQLCPVGGGSAIVVGPHGEIRLAEGSYREEAARRGLNLTRKADPYGHY